MEHKGGVGPISAKQRYIILDALRGFALLGIAIANFPEFSLWSFLSEADAAAMPTASVDRVVHWAEYLLVDGKFYTLFSLLFGIGFSIIIGNAAKRGANGFRIFYRRMTLLLIIGLLHLFFLWSGDILALYALMGMLLPLFRNCSNKTLLRWAAVLLVLPIGVDAVVELWRLQPASWFYDKMWYYCGVYGITEERYAYWLQEQTTYAGMFQFLVQGAYERMTEFIDGNRYFKVLGLFVLGFYIGRNRLYARLEEIRPLLRKVLRVGLVVGLPLSFVYAHSCMMHHPWGLTIHTMLYTFSVFPLAFGYVAAIVLAYLRFGETSLTRFFAAPGRMALSCYIGQTLFGILLFYGVGFGLGAHIGLVWVLFITLAVYLIEVILAHLWLRFFQFGPLEWIWRMLTYGKYLPLKNK
ncbi:MAG: DUF418 domain-containing protein [Bacteroidales bacterium]|nr:DUF418 domain-containing protein [Bacteroidales bacterium]